MPDDYEAFRTILVDKPIAFYPSLARLFGGINEALFFQQIAYWSGKGADPIWIYKTREELEEETCLSRYQQEQARKTLVKLGVLEEVKRGLPAKLFYRIVWEQLYAIYGAAAKGASNSPARMRETDIQAGKDARNSQSRVLGTDQLVGEEVAGRDASNWPAITENTAENTDRDISKLRTDPTDFEKYDADRDVLLNYIADFAREFFDQAPLASSVSRAQNLYRSSGLSLEDFVERMYAARAITKERSASVRGEMDQSGRKQKMAYFFSCLERELTKESA